MDYLLYCSDVAGSNPGRRRADEITPKKVETTIHVCLGISIVSHLGMKSQQHTYPFSLYSDSLAYVELKIQLGEPRSLGCLNEGGLSYYIEFNLSPEAFESTTSW